jgi:hypothetical protein
MLFIYALENLMQKLLALTYQTIEMILWFISLNIFSYRFRNSVIQSYE